MKPNKVRAIAICLFRRGHKILAAEGHDEAKREVFYRPLGGTIEFSEYSPQTIAREMREELGAEVAGVRYLFTLENVFTYNGRPGHEIVLVCDGAFADETLYEREHLDVADDGGRPAIARWMPLDAFASGKPPLYPSGLLEKLSGAEAAGG